MINRDNYRILFDPFSDIAENLRDRLERLIIHTYIAENETMILENFSGYNIRIDVNRDYEGPGNFYFIEISKDNRMYELGVNIKSA